MSSDNEPLKNQLPMLLFLAAFLSTVQKCVPMKHTGSGTQQMFYVYSIVWLKKIAHHLISTTKKIFL